VQHAYLAACVILYSDATMQVMFLNLRIFVNFFWSERYWKCHEINKVHSLFRHSKISTLCTNARSGHVLQCYSTYIMACQPETNQLIRHAWDI